MHDDFDPAAAASLLARAWRSGEQLIELPADMRPQTLAQGYDVQDRLMELLDEPVAGWKLGLGSAAQKRQTGIGRSIAGRVLRSRLYRAGDAVPLPGPAPATIEFEVAYVLGRDVRPEDAAVSPADVVAEVRTAFELVLSRFVDRRAVGWPSFAADDAGFHALVLGEAIEPERVDELTRTLVVSVDGKEAARSLGGDDATDPLAALQDLFAIVRERGMVLPKGSIVSTGTVSKPFNVAAPAAEISARFLGTEFGFRTEVGASARKPS